MGRELTVKLEPGESKEVVLEVHGALAGTARKVIAVARPSGRRSTIIEIPGGAR
jgi:hypothetical protein